MFYLVGIILTIFLFFLLLMKRNKVYSDKVLIGKIYGQNFSDNPTLPYYGELSILKRFQ